MAEEKPKFEKKKEVVVEKKAEAKAEVVVDKVESGFSLEKKAKAILDSSMPEEQKTAYLKQIGWIVAPSSDGKVTFATYAKVRGIEKGRQSALMAYPKAKNIRLAALEEWDEIFKKF